MSLAETVARLGHRSSTHIAQWIDRVQTDTDERIAQVTGRTASWLDEAGAVFADATDTAAEAAARATERAAGSAGRRAEQACARLGRTASRWSRELGDRVVHVGDDLGPNRPPDA